jgi:hypothetical protein
VIVNSKLLIMDIVRYTAKDELLNSSGLLLPTLNVEALVDFISSQDVKLSSKSLQTYFKTVF